MHPKTKTRPIGQQLGFCVQFALFFENAALVESRVRLLAFVVVMAGEEPTDTVTKVVLVFAVKARAVRPRMKAPAISLISNESAAEPLAVLVLDVELAVLEPMDPAPRVLVPLRRGQHAIAVERAVTKTTDICASFCNHNSGRSRDAPRRAQCALSGDFLYVVVHRASTDYQ
eukprot:Amastigsp_a509342_27.p2 type:complete len:172 gc:universal Amastigsp_a509342_27:590-75(-)